MKLSTWRRDKGWTQQQLADAVGVTQPYISAIERAIEPQVPRDTDFLRRVYVLTRGAVQPNDFYDIPSWEAEAIKAEAEAELARAA